MSAGQNCLIGRMGKMTINGEGSTLEKNCTVSEFLEAHSYRRDRIAVEINGVILPREQYEERLLRDSDQVEIVQFMGGG